MTVFSVIAMLGGLAFFLYGMNVMSSGLEKMAGGALEKTLQKVTSNRFISLLLGMGITVTIQSSSALTVMLVGLVNSGILEFGQTIGILMGSNIGTTVTAWILSLMGIESDSVLMNILKPKNFSPIFALVGVIMYLAGKNDKKKSIGSILIGFSILMYGMTVMSETVEPLAQSDTFIGILTAFKNPIIALITGIVFTGIIQSSSASVGVLQALSVTGAISYGTAIPIIMGQNIGTCVTAVISSIGVSKNAKKVAVIHLAFNIIGTVIFLIPYFCIVYFINTSFLDTAVTPVTVAVIHTIFNVTTTLILLPFSKLLEKIANFAVRDVSDTKAEIIFDDRLLTVPSVAVSKVFSCAVNMAFWAEESVDNSITVLKNYSEKKVLAVQECEKQLDKYEDTLGSFLVKLSKTDLNDSDMRLITKILHTISDFERIGDHAESLAASAKEINDKKIHFSDAEKREINVLESAVSEIIQLTVLCFEKNSTATAAKVEPLEQTVDKLIAEIKSHHIERLQKGISPILYGFILNDILTDFSRISDHCSNIAVAVIEAEKDKFDTHKYLNKIKSQSSGSFRKMYNEYCKKYSLKSE